MSLSDESEYQSRMKNSTDEDDEDIVDDDDDEEEYNENDAITYEDNKNDNDAIAYEDNKNENDDDDDGDDEDDEEDDDDDDDDSSDSSPEIKRPRFDSFNINKVLKVEPENSNKIPVKSIKDFGKKYMTSYGFKEGQGLGKYQDGIVEPIEAAKQKGRRGFGFEAINLKEVISKYDPDSCKVSVDEKHKVVWLHNKNNESISKELLESWVKMGPPKKCIDDNSLFCDSHIINKILSSKNVLNLITPLVRRNGRSRSNPFETISKAIFLNRAAMKMSNMDAILDWIFTNPKNMKGEKIIGQNDLLYFADVCAGPGGFSEYVLYRKNWRAKGFGFTLRAQNDFKLHEFIAGPCETFEPYYGAKDDGDVYRPENLESFRDYVLKHTNEKGVHFMMADGGLKIDEKFNDQELMCKKLYLCQCLMALLIVRTEGHFVVKLFDLFTTFSVGLVYLMYRCFRQILIIKPNTSRPANSERYLVCKWKLEDCEDVTKHLFEINKKVPNYEDKGREDVLELVPTDVLLGDTQFKEYIISSNNKIGEDQASHLIRLAVFSENSELKDEKQADYRKQCLELWNIPDTARTEPKCDPESKWAEITGCASPADFEKSLLTNKITTLDYFKKYIYSIYNWYGLVISGDENSHNRAFYLGLGRSNVYKYMGGKWIKWNDGQGTQDVVGLCLPPYSLVYGELVTEYLKEGKSQIRTYGFHIIDAIRLGNEDISRLPFLERWNACKLFAKSLKNEKLSICVKEYVKLEDIDSLFRKVVFKSIKGCMSKALCISINENTFWKASGVMFIKDTLGLWNRFLSKGNGIHYVYNTKSKSSIFEKDISENKKGDIFANFEPSFRNAMIWWWGDGVVVHQDPERRGDQKKMQAKDLSEYVERKKYN